MRFRLFLASALFALAFAGGANARGTLDSILPGIRAEYPGRLSDAQPYTDGEGRTRYRIKWMTPDGRILFFDADPNSGRFQNTGSGGADDWRSGGGRHGGQAQPDDAPGRHSNWQGDGYGIWNGGGDGGGRGDWHGHGGNGDGRGGNGDGRGGEWNGGDWRGGSHGDGRGDGRWNGGGDHGGRRHGGDN